MSLVDLTWTDAIKYALVTLCFFGIGCGIILMILVWWESRKEGRREEND